MIMTKFLLGMFFINKLGLDIVYVYAKFDDCSFSCSREMVGAHQNLNGSRDLTTPQGCFVIHRLGLASVNLPIKSEIFIFAHCKDMKRDTKC